MTSSISWAATPARSRTALMTVAPSSWAGVLAKPPLKEPTAVRAALAITIEGVIYFSSLAGGDWQSFEYKSNAESCFKRCC
ncbi:exported hypothetical protein [Agrobacterium fabacearum S56]|nr:exported hypothetical protein [Agrobacterium fabacearum S56]